MNKALRIAIIERGLKQTDVARRIGVDDARMSGFVHGRHEPTDRQKKRIARLLRKSVPEIFPETQSNDAGDAAPLKEVVRSA